MAAFLEAPVGTIAFCWRLERADGVCMGFTTHDRDLEIGHLTYRAAPGMVPSAIAMSDGFDAARLDIGGALTSAAITESDLRSGRWDRAAVRIFMVDWTDPEGGQVALASGEIGDVSIEGGAFSAELRGATAILDRPVVEQTSPECRAQLGDRRCRVDLAPRSRMTRVVSAEEDVVVVAEAAAGNPYGYGQLRWIGGANSGLASQIAASDGARLTLREPPVFAPAAGDLIEIVEGCDRSFTTCRTRFGNAANFRGEPHLPGIDLLTRYPGA
ncbi:DUF2163 domain-containing protein [Allosphingosinicella flava]|uniref:DUF2163 domain-containing protein n=1 Tax=Allosphingosinicella flava TaxID=2771430 RepID=A0A7T2GLN9_9SPHN|nr:DUF2163 domain-containing protein [Sphingosinicella flava]QPQ56072.1 DUF2163 domain-containing protein [Sphingosinicella flava]